MVFGQVESTGTRIQSVTRAARVLLLIASLPEEERTVSNIASALGSTIPTAYHLLNTLVDAKFLTRDLSKRYQFGISIGVLSAAYESQTLPSLALTQPLQNLVNATGETAYFSAWRNGDIEIQAQLTGHLAVQVSRLQPGFHTDAHARASGKVLLSFAEDQVRERYLAKHELRVLTDKTLVAPDALRAELQKVRAQGFATEEEEFSIGVACISVPVRAHDYLVGAYTLSTPIERYIASRDEYLARLLDAAREAIDLA